LADDTNAFDVGAEPCAVVLDEVDADVCDLDLVVEPPGGLAMAEFLTRCWFFVEVD
jgi:hypothetical protein